LAGQMEISALLRDPAFVAIVAVEADVGGVAAERAEQLACVGGLRPDVVDLRQESPIVPVEPLGIRYGDVDRRRRQVLQPDVLEHEVDIGTRRLCLATRPAPRQPRARRELRQRRATAPRLHRVDDRDVYLMTRSLQRAGEQIDIPRQADAVGLADDVDAHRAPHGGSIRKWRRLKRGAAHTSAAHCTAVQPAVSAGAPGARAAAASLCVNDRRRLRETLAQARANASPRRLPTILTSPGLMRSLENTCTFRPLLDSCMPRRSAAICSARAEKKLMCWPPSGA